MKPLAIALIFSDAFRAVAFRAEAFRAVALCAVALCAAALGVGCNANRMDHQDTPLVTRVTTTPTQCTLIHVDTNLQLVTPCDFTADQLDEDDVFQISKRGYTTWEGSITSLPQTAQGTYHCALQKLN